MHPDYRVRMRSFRIGAVAVALLLTTAPLTSCAPSPGAESDEPTPMFASDEEAFAAAEVTYQAYLDAVNRGRDGGSGDPQSFLIASALEAEISGARQLTTAGITVRGPSHIQSFAGLTYVTGVGGEVVTAELCLDGSNTVVLDAQGSDVTPIHRQSISPVDVSFLVSGEELLINQSSPGGHTC